MRRFLVLSISLLFLGFSFPAIACLGPHSETRTFLHSLPQEAATKPYIAQIKIDSIDQKKREHNFKTYVTASVVSSLKGFDKGENITVIANLLSSCAADADVKEGQTYYISGSINDDGYFTGEWQGLVFQSFSPY